MGNTYSSKYCTICTVYHTSRNWAYIPLTSEWQIYVISAKLVFTCALKGNFPKLVTSTYVYSCALLSFIRSPENKTCQDHTGKLIPDFQEKNGEHCTLGDEMKASAGMWKIQRKKVSEKFWFTAWPFSPVQPAQWLFSAFLIFSMWNPHW